MNIRHSVTELIGHTPLLEPIQYNKKHDLNARLTLKLESFNPAGSAKDRIAAKMIETAESSGQLKPGGTIIEPTSGNTGIGLAAIGASKGYRVIVVMPDTMSAERIMLVRAYGAEIVLTPGSEGMSGAIRKAEELRDSIPGAMIAGQFDNPANPQAHYETTGPEILDDTDGDLAVFVAGVGTGGTISGTGKYLKEKIPGIRIIAVEPSDSPLLSEGKAGSHDLQGIGADFVPAILDRSVIDEIMTVTTEQAYSAARELAACEGILTGISSGAALWAATEIAKRPEYREKRIVVLLPDTGDRYLSTDLYSK